MRDDLVNVLVELLQRALSEGVRYSVGSSPSGGSDAVRGLALELLSLALEFSDTLLAVLNLVLDVFDQVLLVGEECAVAQLVMQNLKHAEKMFQLLDSVGDVGFLALVGRIKVDERLRDLDAQRKNAGYACGH